MLHLSFSQCMLSASVLTLWRFQGTVPPALVRPLFQIQRPTAFSTLNRPRRLICSCLSASSASRAAFRSSSLETSSSAALTSSMFAFTSRSVPISRMPTLVVISSRRLLTTVLSSCVEYIALSRELSSRSRMPCTDATLALLASASFIWLVSTLRPSMRFTSSSSTLRDSSDLDTSQALTLDSSTRSCSRRPDGSARCTRELTSFTMLSKRLSIDRTCELMASVPAWRCDFSCCSSPASASMSLESALWTASSLKVLLRSSRTS
mmetsp:Transcript_37162/g.94968  ORF Transcript_37162/g.94968 Transcript_37162/m.94968 type:complete len:264 (+) Transcript_37162:315-1106(+)